jgi:hypothetical protein
MSAPTRDLFGAAVDLAERPKTHRRLRTRRPLPRHVLTGADAALGLRDESDVLSVAVVRNTEGKHVLWVDGRRVGAFASSDAAQAAAVWQTERLGRRRKARRRWGNET